MLHRTFVVWDGVYATWDSCSMGQCFATWDSSSKGWCFATWDSCSMGWVLRYIGHL